MGLAAVRMSEWSLFRTRASRLIFMVFGIIFPIFQQSFLCHSVICKIFYTPIGRSRRGEGTGGSDSNIKQFLGVGTLSKEPKPSMPLFSLIYFVVFVIASLLVPHFIEFIFNTSLDVFRPRC